MLKNRKFCVDLDLWYGIYFLDELFIQMYIFDYFKIILKYFFFIGVGENNGYIL